MGRGTLSVCMIVKNEARNIAECLACVKSFADEVIVVDTGSADNTAELAQKAGARLYSFAWRDDFSAARNESIRHAKSDWILWFDADDRIEKKDAELLARLKRVAPRDTVFCFEIISRTPRGDSPPFMQMRLFPRNPGIRFENRIHESIGRSVVTLGLKVEYTNFPLYHIGYMEGEAVQEKLLRNLRLIHLDLADDPFNTAHRYQLSQTYAALGKTDECIGELIKIMEVPKERRIQRFVYEHTPAEIANRYFLLGRYDESMAYVKQALVLNPANIVALFLKAEILRMRGENEAAREIYRAVAEGKFEPHSIPIDIPNYQNQARQRFAELKQGRFIKRPCF